MVGTKRGMVAWTVSRCAVATALAIPVLVGVLAGPGWGAAVLAVLTFAFAFCRIAAQADRDDLDDWE